MRYARPRTRPQGNTHRPPRPRYNPKVRAGLVMGPNMDYGGLGDPERIFVEEGVALAPMSCGGQETISVHAGAITVLPTASVRDIEDGSLAGVVAPGGHAQDDVKTSAAFDKLIATAREEKLPVMAFGDAVERTLTSLGYASEGRTMPPAVLVHDGVRILESMDDVRDAAAVFRAAA